MNLAIISAAAASIIAGIAAWQVQNWRYEGIISDIKYEQSEAARKVFESAQREYEKYIARKDQALNEATERSKKNQALARALDSDVDSLRDELTTARADLSKASAEAVRRYSEAQSNVVGACTARLVEVAKHADQCASDLRLMQDAWPD